MSSFHGLNDATPTQGPEDRYFSPGTYHVRVLRLLERPKQGNPGILNRILEVEVIQSDNRMICAGQHRSQIVPSTWSQAMDHLAGWLRTIINSSPEAMAKYKAVGGDLVRFAVEVAFADDGTNLAGAEIGLHCTQTTTRAGKPFTRHVWFVPGTRPWPWDLEPEAGPADPFTSPF